MPLLPKGWDLAARTPGGSLLAMVAAGGALLAAAAFVNAAIAKQTEQQHPPKGQFIEIDGVRLHYLEKGTGTPVVLLHGNAVMAEDFSVSGVLDLVAQNHRVIAFDRPGFGYSERPRTTMWTPTAQAALFHKALQHLGIHQPVVVGHSWGTLVTLAMALNYPTDVSAIVLLSGYYFPDARADVVLASGPAIPVVGNILRYSIAPLMSPLTLPAAIKKMFAPATVSTGFKERFPTPMMSRPSQIRASAAEGALMIPGAAALVDRHAELSMPVVIMAGTDDKIVSTEAQSARLHGDVGQSEIRRVPGAGHMVHHMVPRQVAEAIQDAAAAGSRHLLNTLPTAGPRTTQAAA